MSAQQRGVHAQAREVGRDILYNWMVGVDDYEPDPAFVMGPRADSEKYHVVRPEDGMLGGRSTAEAAWPRAVQLGGRGLPQRLFDAWRRAPTYSFMGLLPDVHTAWLSFDSPNNSNELVIWDYEPIPVDRAPRAALADFENAEADHDDYGYSTVRRLRGFRSPVLSVALVPARGDRFLTALNSADVGTATTTFLLLASTHGAVHIFAVETSPAPPAARATASAVPRGLSVSHIHGGFDDNGQALGSALIEVPTDGVMFVHFAATPSGRIFAGGDNGCVYELEFSEWGQVSAPGTIATFVRGAVIVSAKIAARLIGLGLSNARSRYSARLKNISLSNVSVVLAAMTMQSPADAGGPVKKLVHDHERGLLWALQFEPDRGSRDGKEQRARLRAWSTVASSSAEAPEPFLPPAGFDGAIYAPVGDIQNMNAESKAWVNGPLHVHFDVDSTKTDLFESTDAEWADLNSRDSARTLVTPLQSIHVVPACDSQVIHLVAVAESGARLYFTTLSKERERDLRQGRGSPLSSRAGPGHDLRIVQILAPPQAPPAPAAAGAEPVGIFERLAALRSPDLNIPSEKSRRRQPMGGANPGKFLSVEDTTVASLRGAVLPLQPLGLPPAGQTVQSDVLFISPPFEKTRVPQPAGYVQPEALSCLRVAGRVYAISELAPHAFPRAPSVTMDASFTPAGALALVGGGAPLPWRAAEARIGGLTVDGRDEWLLAQPVFTDGNLTRSMGAASASACMPGEVGAWQDALDDSGVAPEDQHIVRRRLWDCAPGWNVPAPWAPWVRANGAGAEASTAWTILTQLGVTHVALESPADVLTRILALKDPVESRGNQAAPGLFEDNDALNGLLRNIGQNEFCTLAAAVAIGDVPHENGAVPLPVARAVLVRRAKLALDIFKDLKKKAPEVRSLIQLPWLPNMTNASAPQPVLSALGASLLLLASRMLRPFCGNHVRSGSTPRMGEFIFDNRRQPLADGDALRDLITGRAHLGQTTDAKFKTASSDWYVPVFTEPECLELRTRLHNIATLIEEKFDLVRLVREAPDGIFSLCVGSLADRKSVV